MTSKVRVQSGICGFETIIEASDIGSGEVEIKIESQCKSVQTNAEKLRKATTDDLIEWKSSKVIDLASETGSPPPASSPPPSSTSAGSSSG